MMPEGKRSAQAEAQPGRDPKGLERGALGGGTEGVARNHLEIHHVQSRSGPLKPAVSRHTDTYGNQQVSHRLIR